MRVLSTWIALCAIAISVCAPILRAEGPTWDVRQAEERTVRLNYVNASWSKILNALAEDTGSTLVMHDAPPGRFSRQDWNKYNRRDAVQILNRELERHGFRILEKDQFLTVIESRRRRVEYERPTLTQSGAKPLTTREAIQERDFPSQEWQDAGTAKVTQAGLSEVAEDADQPRRLNAAQPRQMEFSNSVEENPLQKRSQHILKTAYEDSAEETSASTKITTQHKRALDIARQIHEAFAKRSRLENKGPNGLPAFVVAEEGKPDSTQFTVEINTEDNEIIVTGPPSIQAGIRNLVQMMDKPPVDQEDSKIVPGDEKMAEVGRKLQQPLSVIAQARQEAVGPTGNQQPGSTAVIGRDNEGLPALIGNLKGDVSIEALDDLDLLILRGNQKDVEAVMQVIQAVEQMAVGSLPEIHLLKLSHVDSQSLAQLLNDVYEQLSELRSDNAQQSATSVNVVPVVTPNAVLILAPQNTMPAILDLADELDQPINPDHQVKVFRLKHAVSETVVTLLSEFYGEEPVGLGTRIRVSADARTNSVVVQARPRDLTEISKVISEIDADHADSVNRMKIFPLKSALADELAEFLFAAIQSVADPRASTVGQTSSQNNTANINQEAKAVVLEFLAEDGKKLIRSGLLADIRFNADPRTNSLAVTAPEQSMPLIEELIHLLDQPSSSVAEIKVFQLDNSDAADAVELLQELFGDNNTNQSSTTQNRNLGVELIGAQGSASNLIPMRFSVDVRSNSVVAIGGADSLRIVEAILLRLDSEDSRQRQTKVIKLRNVAAADVAVAINEFLQAQRDLATIDPDRISTSQLLEQEVIVTPDEVTNSLLISATPSYFDSIIELTQQLDAEPAQVIIQALLVEVELNHTDEFGVELGFQDSILFDRGLLGQAVSIVETIVNGTNTTQTTATNAFGVPTPGFGFNNQPLGVNNVNPSSVGSQGLSSFALGRVNNDFGYGGLVLSASSESVSVLIRALAARRNVRVLSRPQIMALDNQEAQIQVGQVVPVSDGVSITNNNVIPLVTRDPAGIILTVIPRINSEGQVVMEVVAEKSAYTDMGVTVFTDATTGTQVTSPIKNITTASSTVKVPDGQTVVMGGMITQNDDSIRRKIPWLGDLPWIGNAFRYDTTTHNRTELLIFLTPRVVRHSGDTEMIKEVEAQRLHWFEYEAEEVHGPIFGLPQETGMPSDVIYQDVIDDGYSIDMQSGVPPQPTLVIPPVAE